MGIEYQREVIVKGHYPVSPSIIFYDDIEGAFKWRTSGSGTGWVAEKYAGTTDVNNGSYSLRMYTATTTPAVGDWVDITRYVSLRKWKTIRFSCFFRPVTQAGYEFLRFILGFYSGTTYKEIGIQWKSPTKQWEYEPSSNTWSPIPGAEQKLYEYAYHYFSCILNFEKNQIRQFQCDDLFLDNLNLPGWETPNTSANCFKIVITLRSAVAASQQIFFDDFLLEEAT